MGRMLIFIGLTVYLVAIIFVIIGINSTLDTKIGYNSTQNKVTGGGTVLGVIGTIGGFDNTEELNMPSGNFGLPIWFYIIFVGIPIIFWGFILYTLLTPFGNAGS